MNYDKYLKLCRDKYKTDMNLDTLPDLDEFYDNPVIKVPIESFSDTYMESILAVKNRIKEYFDKNLIFIPTLHYAAPSSQLLYSFVFFDEPDISFSYVYRLYRRRPRFSASEVAQTPAKPVLNRKGMA